jgi:putative ABC transport system permease protein
MERITQDLFHALRFLRKAPGFTAIVIVSLSLGMGANTAIFTVVNAVLLRALPVAHPEQLFELARSNAQKPVATSFNYPFYRQLLNRNNLLKGVLCQKGMAPTLFAQGQSQNIVGELVSGNYFDVLGIKPYLGRLLHGYDETSAGADRVAVLGYGFSRQRFGGDPKIVGKAITLNMVPVTVIGVLPRNYQSLTTGFSPDVQVPITMWPKMSGDEVALRNPDHWWVNIVCRLQRGTTSARAGAWVDALYKHDLQTSQTERFLSFQRKRACKVLCGRRHANCSFCWLS